MKNLSTFQLAILIVFVGLLLLGVLIFSGILPGFRSVPGGSGGEVSVWGTLPQATAEKFLTKVNDSYKNDFTIVYTEKPLDSIERDFITAKADNRAPDLLIVPHEVLLSQIGRVVPVSAETYPTRTFLDHYPEAGRIFLRPEGVVALPLVIDPLVLYYNRDLLTTAGLPITPKTWTEFIAKTVSLTKIDSRRNILQSAIALGDYRNISRMKEIISMLMLQAGNPIFELASGRPHSVLNEAFGFTLKPAVAVLDFYSQFADPSRPNYSWNRSLPEAKQNFIRGQSAFYLGLASEFNEISQANPHLSFDVALPPQRETNSRVTFARVIGVGLVAGGSKTATAWLAEKAIATAGPQLASELYLPPAVATSLAETPTDPVLAVFYQAAIAGRNWFDFNSAGTKAVFERMIDNVLTGRLPSAGAVSEANGSLDNLVSSIYGRAN